ncbi:hypothetical protein C8R43DRAFT_873400, partial [Mycena crocata]
METEAELRIRLEEVSSLIELQNQVLRDLEKTKSDIRSQLNTFSDPMARLPLEISSEIFMLCLPRNPLPNKKYAPLIFLNICHAWSDIALSTPLLW